MIITERLFNIDLSSPYPDRLVGIFPLEGGVRGMTRPTINLTGSSL